MYRRRTILATLLVGTMLAGAGTSTYAAGRHGQGTQAKAPKSGAAPAAQGTKAGTGQNANKRMGPGMPSITFHPAQQSGVVAALSGGGFTLDLPQALPLTVTVSVTTTYQVGGAQGTLAAVQPGLYVRVAGHFDPATHAYAAQRVTVLLPRVVGTVQTTNGTGFTLLSERGQSVTVTTTAATKWLATPKMHREMRHGSNGGATAPISSTTTMSGTMPMSGTATVPPTTVAQALVAGERALVEGVPGADGLSITATRILLGPAANQPAVMPGDDDATAGPAGSGTGQ